LTKGQGKQVPEQKEKRNSLQDVTKRGDMVTVGPTGKSKQRKIGKNEKTKRLSDQQTAVSKRLIMNKSTCQERSLKRSKKTASQLLEKLRAQSRIHARQGPTTGPRKETIRVQPSH